MCDFGASMTSPKIKDILLYIVLFFSMWGFERGSMTVEYKLVSYSHVGMTVEYIPVYHNHVYIHCTRGPHVTISTWLTPDRAGATSWRTPKWPGSAWGTCMCFMWSGLFWLKCAWTLQQASSIVSSASLNKHYQQKKKQSLSVGFLFRFVKIPQYSVRFDRKKKKQVYVLNLIYCCYISLRRFLMFDIAQVAFYDYFARVKWIAYAQMRRFVGFIAVSLAY